MTSPTNGFTAPVAESIALSARATCPAGSVPEYQYWVKPLSAANWTVISPFVSGAWSWTPPSVGNWALTAVTRAVGAPESYQARASASAGTITAKNHAPRARNDLIATNQHVAGSVDVVANDTDPDGDALAVTAHTSPAHGTVTFAGTVATYTPAPGFVGNDSFSYTIGDNHDGTSSATVQVTVADQPPVVNDDAIATLQNVTGSINVLVNDSDPDGDALTVSAFTQGAHGSVAIANGVATFLPDDHFLGTDSFTYTVDDGHGATATGTVVVTVSAALGCSIAITGPATATYGETVHLVASAQCSGGEPQIQWLHRINSAYEIIQPFGAATEIDYTVGVVGTNTFYAIARQGGLTPSFASSNFIKMKIVDNVPQCTAVKMTAPTSSTDLTIGVPATLSASATCPAGAVPEYQFWVKPLNAPNWSFLPGFTTGNGSWTPTTAGTWAIRAVVRTVGAHVNYQIGSGAAVVNVIP